MFDWLVPLSWVLAVLLLFLLRRKAVNSPSTVLAIGSVSAPGAARVRRGRGGFGRRRGRGFIPSGGGGFTPEDGSSRHPFDPFSGVRHPNAPRPGCNGAVIAVEEPDESEPMTLVGVSR